MKRLFQLKALVLIIQNGKRGLPLLTRFFSFFSVYTLIHTTLQTQACIHILGGDGTELSSFVKMQCHLFGQYTCFSTARLINKLLVVFCSFLVSGWLSFLSLKFICRNWQNYLKNLERMFWMQQRSLKN